MDELDLEELERLRTAHARVPDPTPAAERHGRERLRRTMGTQDGQRLRRLAVPAIALAVVLLTLVAVSPIIDGPSPVSGPPAAAAARLCLRAEPGPAAPCLAALGEVAAAAHILAGGDIFYRRDLIASGVVRFGRDARPTPRVEPGGFDVTLPGIQELWLTAERAGRYIHRRNGEPYLASRADERAWRAAGAPPLESILPPIDQRDAGESRNFGPGRADELLLGAGSLDKVLDDRDPFAGFPTDPAALHDYLMRLAWEQRTRISEDRACQPDLRDCTSTTIRNIRNQFASNATILLRHPLAPAELRRGLFRVLSELDGAQLMGPLREPAGRIGAAILLPDDVNNGRNALVFDARTAELLADGRTDDGTSDSLRWASVYSIDSGSVGQIGERP